jgi:carbamoyltransferase
MCGGSRLSTRRRMPFRCFMGSEIEVMAVGNCSLNKDRQDPILKIVYEDDVELD